MIQLVHQPQGSNLCGQCCVAMILGIPLGCVVALLRKGRTTTKQLRDALRSFGILTADRAERMTSSKSLPNLAIYKMRFEGTWKSHWVVVSQGKVYDPGGNGTGGRLTSYLECSRA